MGKVRKLTGAQGQIDVMNANANAQANATRQAAADAQKQLMLSAKAAADQQSLMSARMVAESKAADAVSTPLQVATVELATTQATAVQDRKKRKSSFSAPSAGGVSI